VRRRRQNLVAPRAALDRARAWALAPTTAPAAPPAPTILAAIAAGARHQLHRRRAAIAVEITRRRRFTRLARRARTVLAPSAAFVTPCPRLLVAPPATPIVVTTRPAGLGTTATARACGLASAALFARPTSAAMAVPIATASAAITAARTLAAPAPAAVSPAALANFASLAAPPRIGLAYRAARPWHDAHLVWPRAEAEEAARAFLEHRDHHFGP